MSDPNAAAPSRLSEAEKERIKLSASFMNSIAVAVFAIGGLAPLFSYIYGSTPSPRSPAFVGAITAGCTLLSGVLHVLGRRLLKGLSP